MPKPPEWLDAEIQESYPACQGNIRAIQRAIAEKRGVQIAYMTISDHLDDLGLERPRQKSRQAKQEATTPDVPATAAIAPVSEPLSPAEVQTLEHYEQIIAQGIKTFVQVGQALLAIRDQRLYRQSHDTFEDYLRQRWDLGQSRAYQLMDAAGVVTNLKSSTTVELPANESQTRPLAALPPEQQREVWQQAVETAPPTGITAKHVQATVKRLRTATDASRRQQERPTPDRARQAAEWRDRFRHQFREVEHLIDRFKQAGGVLVLVRDWEVPWQREFLQELRNHAKTLQDIVAHLEKVIIGEEAALNALSHTTDR